MLERMWSNWNWNTLKVRVKNTIRDIYAKPTAIPWWKTESFSPEIKNKTGFPFSLLLFSTVLEVLAREVRQEKKVPN